ncbi:flagellar hook-length control protein FliK [Shewanella sp. 3_MG-2023]|uniref:flagellar hook-length control protein FliK n=1 Tax=Shewanella sp. 3_MG-2023 TaxID=3062635 RepID=UPI0026E2C1E4|nr:flagellar hook-length control protein FliK [Shewanella sp. 3_MG-2023]MDO6774734.1 flagellar hook-length control protein FliK [Shewanella sp. 3_MG-2023]
MQQVSNILLGNSNKIANSPTGETPQGTDSSSFLSALNQVSQTDEIQGSTEQASENNTDINLVDDNASQEHIAAETDIALIFAQIDLAENFETNSQPTGGNILPLAIEADSTTEFLSDYSAEQLQNLSEFSAMSAAELSALSVKELNQLITDFNQQTPIQGGALLPLIELATTSAIDNAEKPALALSSGFSSIHKNIMDNNSAAVDVNKNLVDVNKGLVDANKTLGDPDSIEGKITSKESGVNLSKAEFSVSMDKSAIPSSANSPSSNALANNAIALSAGEFTLDAESVDLKAIQNQSSLTSVHKSDVPQFQLSLRQGSESVGQMQEMIQKFAPVMKQQLMTMVGQGIQHAEIRLDPAELGHMVVRVQVNGDQTQVQFQVAQTQTRDLLEQAIPRLREMLAEEGLQLADSHVSQDGEQQKNADYDESSASNDRLLDEISAQELEIVTKHAMSGSSAIDYYA